MTNKFYRIKLILTGLLISLAAVFLLTYILAVHFFPITLREITNTIESPNTVAFYEMDGVWVVVKKATIEEQTMYGLRIYEPSLIFNRYVSHTALHFDGGAIHTIAAGQNMIMRVDVVGMHIEMESIFTHANQRFLWTHFIGHFTSVILIAIWYYNWALKRKQKAEALAGEESET